MPLFLILIIIIAVVLLIIAILLLGSAREVGTILIIVLAGTGTLQAQGVTLHLAVMQDTTIVLYSNVPVDTAAFQNHNDYIMSDTIKDREKAAIKRGSKEYQRNNPKRKYRREHSLPSDVQPYINAPAVKEGFWAMVRRAFGG